MIVPAAIKSRYDDTLPFLERLESLVRGTLIPFCKENHYLFDGRLKSIESIAEKIETGRYKTWSEIDDLYAATIVVPLKSSEPTVLSFLESVFDVHETKRRTDSNISPDSFRFDSTRVIARLRPNPLNTGTTVSVSDILFEIQIRSTFEHAWASATHALSYKTNTISWQTQRLSSILKAVVEQLDSTIAGFEQATGSIGDGNWPGIEDQVLIVSTFSGEIQNGRIPRELEPKDWSRFAQNLIHVIAKAKKQSTFGHRNISELTRIVKVITDEIRILGESRIPRSLTLYQFCIATLLKKKVIKSESIKIPLLVSDEMRNLYPDISFPKLSFTFE